MVTETSAELMRRSHPNRLRFEMFSDAEPVDAAGRGLGGDGARKSPSREP